MNKLRQHEQQLCELLRHTDKILVRLRAEGDITQREYELIRSQSTDYELVNLLLTMFCDKQVTAYQNFLDALEETNQTYLRHLLEEKGSFLFIFVDYITLHNFMKIVFSV